MKTLNINLGVTEYPVIIDSGMLDDFDKMFNYIGQNKPLYFIVDSFIERNYQFRAASRKYNFSVYVLDGGKNNKNFNSAMKIFQDLDDKNISRDVAIVAVGGGVVGDLSGFIASCWYRGVELISIPTTLLSAVDSCLGGKTAINFRNTVNAIGSYHHPKMILIDTKVINSLPKREISSGYGEIIKYGMIGSEGIREKLMQLNVDCTTDLEELICLSLKQKEAYVCGDVSEQSNRLFLNFGHTIGHAIEFSTVYEGEEVLRHGEGVALGMLAIFRICIHLEYLNEEDISTLRAIIEKLGLPVAFSASSIGMSRDALIDSITSLAFKDKKRTSKNLRLVILDKIGSPTLYETKDEELIKLGVAEVITE
ncbi:MAG: 3-dehydroquinate synthase [Oceanospirillaceae bacterium]|nr:3-dehydroquinate synthase [Oceanospirillaceae bacterium]